MPIKWHSARGAASFVADPLAGWRWAMHSWGMSNDWPSAIKRARAHSPFLSLAMGRLPQITQLLEAGQGEQALLAAKALGVSGIEGGGEPDIAVALRRHRLGLALALGIGDLAGAFPLSRVMSELSGFADYALDAAIKAAIAKRIPDFDGEHSGFCAIALGKQGAGELNYSSDIDPILLFDPETLPKRPSEEPGEAAQRYARGVVETLSQPTGEGYVFRVDLRLRPASEVSPLALPFTAAIKHYESSALAWERAAYIRARSAGGDIAAGEAFLERLRPFVWRRNLDFTAIEEIRRLTARIRETYDGPKVPSAGFDVKRGRGGIREIEFFAQTHQLVYGGRIPALRQHGLRATLDALAAEGIIAASNAQLLGESYDRLRIVEHRLQMVGDRQTHDIPLTQEALDNVAHLDGLSGGAELLSELRGICGQVAHLYDGLLDGGKAQKTAVASIHSEPEDRAVLGGFAAKAEQWRTSLRCLRSEEARAAFDAIAPDLRAAIALAPDPNHAMVRWETLLSHLPSAVNLFRLFEQRPALLETVLHVLTLSRPLADELARRPELLDVLIDASAFDLPESRDEISTRMARCETDNYEVRLDRIRYVVGEERFASGVQMIEARNDPLEIAEGLCRVAEAALQTGADAARERFAKVHGQLPDQELLVLGLGRFGGGALTHASDLDIIYLFTGPIGGTSDGERPLTTSLYFNRLAQRVTGALSVPTAEGALYEIDTRLRPQGNQGLLAVSMESFLRYQSQDAWTWEHMALARARPVYGSPAAREALSNKIHGVLSAPRDAHKLRDDVLKMRTDMARHKPAKGPLDIKLLRGGLVDCEFIVHYLQLREGAAFHPALEVAIAELVRLGHLPAEYGIYHVTLTRFLIAARLLVPGGVMPSEQEGNHDQAAQALAQCCGQDDFARLLQSLAKARHGVAQCWAELFGEELEIGI